MKLSTVSQPPWSMPTRTGACRAIMVVASRWRNQCWVIWRISLRSDQACPIAARASSRRPWRRSSKAIDQSRLVQPIGISDHQLGATDGLGDLAIILIGAMPQQRPEAHKQRRVPITAEQDEHRLIGRGVGIAVELARVVLRSHQISSFSLTSGAIACRLWS